MNVYVYQAALLCQECGLEARAQLATEGKDLSSWDEREYDSDYCPKGPYLDGGGEADLPQHCDHCAVFLENPLTSDGEEYVAGLIVEHLANGRGSTEVLLEWADWYGVTLADLFKRGKTAV